jgi:hypothetical protein
MWCSKVWSMVEWNKIKNFTHRTRNNIQGYIPFRMNNKCFILYKFVWVWVCGYLKSFLGHMLKKVGRTYKKREKNLKSISGREKFCKTFSQKPTKLFSLLLCVFFFLMRSIKTQKKDSKIYLNPFFCWTFHTDSGNGTVVKYQR